MTTLYGSRGETAPDALNHEQKRATGDVLFVLGSLLLSVWFVAVLWVQNDISLADNGDFVRATRLFTVTPVGFSDTLPMEGSPEYLHRYYLAWHKSWIVGWSRSIPSTAAIVLWLPGIAANLALISTTTLSLPIVLAFPKILLLALLIFLLMRSFRHRHRVTILAAVAFPLVMMLTSSDYVAYMNSFYQEGPTLVFLLVVLGALVWLRSHPTVNRSALALLATILLGATKPGNLYWVLGIVPVIGIIFFVRTKAFSRTRALLASSLFAILLTLCLLVAVMAGSKSVRMVNPYHALFMGVLQNSIDPAQRLQDIGFDPADTSAIGLSAFSPAGNSTFLKYKERVSYGKVFDVVLREPGSALRMIVHTLDQLQDLSLEYLGHYEIDDPRSTEEEVDRTKASSRVRTWNTDLGSRALNAWSLMKYRVLPTGVTAILSMILFGGWFFSTRLSDGLRGDLALTGLLTSTGFFVNTVVSVADGNHELIKHLFLSNALYDLSLIAFVASVIATAVEKSRSTRMRVGSPGRAGVREAQGR